MWPAVSPRGEHLLWHWPSRLLCAVSLCMTTTHSTGSLCAAAWTVRGKCYNGQGESKCDSGCRLCSRKFCRTYIHTYIHTNIGMPWISFLACQPLLLQSRIWIPRKVGFNHVGTSRSDLTQQQDLVQFLITSSCPSLKPNI